MTVHWFLQWGDIDEATSLLYSLSNTQIEVTQ